MSISFSQETRESPFIIYIRYKRYFFISLEFDVKRYAWHDAKETVLNGTGASTVLAILKVDEVGVITVVEIIDAKRPLRGVLPVLLAPDGTHVEVVVVGGSIAVALSVIIDPVLFYLVFGTGGCKCLTAIEDPRGTEHPALAEFIDGHDVDVVATVVVGIIPAPLVHTFNLRLRP